MKEEPTSWPTAVNFAVKFQQLKWIKNTREVSPYLQQKPFSRLRVAEQYTQQLEYFPLVPRLSVSYLSSRSAPRT